MASVLKFSNSKVYHFKFIRGRYAKSMLAIISGALLSQKFYLFFPLFVFHFSALYNKLSGMLLSFRSVEIVKERSCAMPSLNILMYNKIIKHTAKPAVHV